ncbi:MAG: outer membrane beta-barrel protein [Cyclobacteriaceae bacterium]|nr:outer membrane beta-barrel protein [Cyclobacteriaceae bacterium]
MKAIRIVLILVCISTVGYSQVTIWPQAGVNLSTSVYNDDSPTDGSNFIYVAFDGSPAPTDYRIYKRKVSESLNFGFYGGVAVDIKVNDQISIRPGLIYSLNQVRVVVENWAVSGGLYSYTGVERTQNRKYITLPVNLVLHHKLWKSEVQTFIGPYVGLALDGGTYSEKGVAGSGTSSGAITQASFYTLSSKMQTRNVPEGNSFGEGQYYNPLDIGFNFGVSYLIGRTMISLKIVRGFTNSQPHFEGSREDDRSQLGSRNFNASLGLSYRIF